MQTRREVLTKCGAGLAAIIAAGKAPAAVVRAMLGARSGINKPQEPSSPYLREVEWLGATGAQFLILPAPPRSCRFDYSIRAYNSGDYYSEMLGCKKNGSYSAFQIIIGGGISDYPTVTMYDRVMFTSSRSIWQEIEVSGTNFSVDGTIVKSNFNNAFNLGWEPSGLGLFATCTDVGTRYGSSNGHRIARFSHSINGEKISDLIPVIDWQHTPCMYDKVSGQFFHNAGTGRFLTNEDA